MKEFINVITTERTQILKAILEHIEISLLAVIIAILIAVPLAIILRKHKRIAVVVLQLTSILQTIPSLALLGMLIPFVGIGTLPAIIALVIYAILPIFQNSYLGLTSFDPSLEEAAEAFGLSESKKLLRIELPLAKEMIMSGIRIAIVAIIGTATLAALIGAGGLGTYILLGIQTNDNSLLLIGAIASALLAIIFSYLLSLAEKLPAKQVYIGVTVIIAIMAGSYVYNQVTKPQQEIVIAGKMGSEPEILINMYKDLIEEDNPKTKVELKANFGETTFLFNALKANQINIYPEFTGTAMEALVKKDITSKNPATTYQTAKTGLSEKFQMQYLQPMQYQNGYALVVTKELANKYHLTKVSDLLAIQSQLKAGFDNDFYHQKNGYHSIEANYQLQINDIKTVDPSFRYRALTQGKVNIIDGFTTDAEIQRYHLVVLKDDEKVFPPYQGAPLMTKEFAQKNPDIVKSLSKLSNQISAADMQEMNYQVTVKHQKAAKVARNYLIKHKLLGN